MRLVIWNVNKAIERKMEVLEGLAPDLAILPESKKDPMFLLNTKYEWRWLGEDPNSGLGFLVAARHALGDLVVSSRAEAPMLNRNGYKAQPGSAG